jgi:hypothetical protein
MTETPTLCRFVLGYEPDGVSNDGLPAFKESVRIYLSRPPYLEVDRVANDGDFTDHPHAYQQFLKEQEGRKLDGRSGYPLAMWPAAAPHEVKMCAARDITTVEQLAAYATRGNLSEVPPDIIELAKRAKKMVELSKATGKHEAKITELEGMIGALREQNNELRRENEALNLSLGQLRARPAA